MKDLLAGGKSVFETVKRCNESIEKAGAIEEEQGKSTGLTLTKEKSSGQKQIESFKKSYLEIFYVIGVLLILEIEFRLIENTREFSSFWIFTDI